MKLLHRLRYQLGTLGLVGLAALLLAILLQLLMNTPMQQQIEQKQTRILQLRNTTHSKPVPVNNEREELAKFYAQFPASSELPDILQSLQSIAEQHQLQTRNADFKFTQVGKLLRYELNFPVLCNYLDLRHFLDDVSMQLPNLALNDIKLTRENIADTQIQARLQLVFFVTE